jgi:polyisoprenyl-teichoic acid--peptidoglycan teichoic acid transferase
MRRLPIALLLLAACSAEATRPITTAPASTTPTTTASATTSAPAPPFLTGATDAWAAAVAAVYGPACQGDRSRLPVELSALAAADVCPTGGIATTAPVTGAVLAAATFGDDLILGADYGAGFEIVALRLPSLGNTDGWYGAVPKIIAVVGADARPGEDPAVTRADSLHLIALNGAGAGGMVGIPRDSWVPIGGGAPNKINAALSGGGPDLLMSTLTSVSGLVIGGYVLTGFEGFQELWGNILGGAEVEVPLAIADPAAGADFQAGRQYLNGPQALSFSRARKSLGGGDLTRQFHGGLVLLGGLERAQTLGPLGLPGLIAAAEPWIRTNIRWGDLLSWSALALATPRENIGNVVVPARVGTVGSASVVFLTDGAASIFADLADGAIAPGT